MREWEDTDLRPRPVASGQIRGASLVDSEIDYGSVIFSGELIAWRKPGSMSQDPIEFGL